VAGSDPTLIEVTLRRLLGLRNSILWVICCRFSPYLQAAKALRVSRGITLLFLGLRH